MDKLVSDLTDWMNKYADTMGTPGDMILEDFAVAFDNVELLDEDDQSPFKIAFEFDLDSWTKVDEESLKETTSEELIQEEINKIDVEDPFAQFMSTLSQEELMEIKILEWRDIMLSREPSEIKRILDEFDLEMILHVFGAFEMDEITGYLEELPEEDW